MDIRLFRWPRRVGELKAATIMLLHPFLYVAHSVLQHDGQKTQQQLLLRQWTLEPTKPVIYILVN